MTEVKAITGDATNLSFIKSNSIDLIVAAPPFINRDPSIYGGDRSKQINFDSKKMLKLLVKSTKEMERVLKPTGSICIEISPEDALIHKYVVEVLKKTNLIYQDSIIHKLKDLEGKSKRDEFVYQDWLMWLHLVKSPHDFYNNPFKVKKYKDPVWELNLTNREDIIDRALAKDDLHILEYTVVADIPERFIEMYTKPGQTVLDPFGGTGTVACVAYKLGRNGISVDVSPDQTKVAEQRISLVKAMNPNV